MFEGHKKTIYTKLLLVFNYFTGYSNKILSYQNIINDTTRNLTCNVKI